MTKTLAEAMIERLAEAGVRRMFGVPGGDANLDFIAAGARHGIDFVLTRTETAAAIMACVTWELTGHCGVAMTTRGPGLANAVNGVAYADLDRAALLLLADGYDDAHAFVSHQRIDQTAILAPMLRLSSALRSDHPLEELEALLEAAQAFPPGPSYLEVAGSRIRGAAGAAPVRRAPPRPAVPDQAAIAQARTLLANARRPIVVAGLQARAGPAATALRAMVAARGCPALTTYKAKGVVSEHEPLGLGLYAGGVAEEPLLSSADLILLYGFDPVEGPPQPWRYGATPILEITNHRFAPALVEPAVSVVGDIARALPLIEDALDCSGWTADELAAKKRAIWSAAAVHPSAPGGGVAPAAVVEAAIAALPADSRVAIDAGAHMLPVLHLWRCAEPSQSLLSRGLSTMGFALPAAIAASLADPKRTTVAFTGDGGLMMCLGELGTAIEAGARPIVVVFNDSALTLIGAKQRHRQLARAGVTFSATDFAAVASAFGWHARRVSAPDQLADAFADARQAAACGPALIDIVVNPESYEGIIRAIRG